MNSVQDLDINSILNNEFGINPSFQETLNGGRNSRTWKVSHAGQDYVVKQYFQTSKWDRKNTEYNFLSMLFSAGVRSIPEPIGVSGRHPIAVYRFIEGRRLKPSEVTREAVERACAFIREINVKAMQQSFAPAAEACFSLEAHISTVNQRVQRLKNTVHYYQQSNFLDLAQDFSDYITHELEPSHNIIAVRASERAKLLSGVVDNVKILSPSDFGFHNALFSAPHTLYFIDFEYAGYDDPGKLVGDFFNQPEVPVDHKYLDDFCSAVFTLVPSSYPLLSYASEILVPLYGIKWCCILLNEFNREDAARRDFASYSESDIVTLQSQLKKARLALENWKRRYT